MNKLIAILAFILGVLVSGAMAVNAGRPCPTPTATHVPTRTPTHIVPYGCAAVVGQTCTPPKITPKVIK